MTLLLVLACARAPMPAASTEVWEPGAPIVGDLGLAKGSAGTVDGGAILAVALRGDRFQLWARADGAMRLARELRGALTNAAVGDGAGWVLADGKVMQVTRAGARAVAEVPAGAELFASMHAVGDVAAFVAAGQAVLFLPAGGVPVPVPPYVPERPLAYPEGAGPEPVWRPDAAGGPLVRPHRDADAGRLGRDEVLAVAYGEGTVDVWSFAARALDRRLHVTPDAYRALGEVAVGPDAVYGLVFAPAVALVEWPAGSEAPRESAVPDALATALARRGVARGLRWTPEGLVAWAGAEVWRRAGGVWTRLPDLPAGGVVARDGGVLALAEDGALRFGEVWVPGRAPMAWLAAGDGRWCVGTAVDARCFDGLDGDPVDVDVAAWAGDVVGGKLHVLTRDGRWARPEEDVPAREVDAAARTIAVSDRGVAAFGTTDGRLVIVDGEDASEIPVGSGWVEGVVWEGGRVAALSAGRVSVVDTLARSFRKLPNNSSFPRALVWVGGRLWAAQGSDAAQGIDPAASDAHWEPLDLRAHAVAVSPAGVVARADGNGRTTIARDGAEPRVLAPWVDAAELAWVTNDLLAWRGSDDVGVIEVTTGAARVVARASGGTGVDPSAGLWRGVVRMHEHTDGKIR